MRKGERMSDEQRAKISAAHRGKVQGPPTAEHRARLSEAPTGRTLDPDHRARIAAAQQRVAADPAYRAKQSEAAKAERATPEGRARLSEAAKAQWANPGTRAKLVAALDQEAPEWLGVQLLRAALISLLRDRDGDLCQLCLDPLDFDLDWRHPSYVHIDHIRPRAAGGTDDPDNLWLAHALCNHKKGARHVGRADGTTDPRREP